MSLLFAKDKKDKDEIGVKCGRLGFESDDGKPLLVALVTFL